MNPYKAYSVDTGLIHDRVSLKNVASARWSTVASLRLSPSGLGI
jgi:hypothetical protein